MDDIDDISLFAVPKKRKQAAGVKPASSLAHGPLKEGGGRALTPAKRGKREAKESVVEEDGEEEGKVEEGTEKSEEEEEEAEGGGDETLATKRSGQEASTSAITTFKEIGVSDWLCGVCRSLGMVLPTQVQQGTIPAVLSGRDVIGLAQTGCGKTAAFALPILQRLALDPYGVFATILTPTRELAMQLAEQFRALGAGMSLKECVVIGGVDMQAQAKNLAKRPHVVIATPGRLKGLMDADGTLAKCFMRARFLVMDEADRLLDPSFEDALRTILGALTLPDRQTLLFSATMTKSLIKLQKAAMRDAYVFQAYEGLQTADRLTEQYLFLPAKVKEVYLSYILTTLLPERKVRSAIIFTSTCRGCSLLSSLLEEMGVSCAALYSGKSQKQRLSALNRFKSEMVPLLIATDVASRGLDIPSVDLVINYDLPILARDYVHRVGRTARAGRSGWSLSLVTQHDVELIHSIEELLGHQLQELKLDESEVLKGITKVYSAKRAAMMKVAQDEGVSKRDIKKNSKLRQLAKSL